MSKKNKILRFTLLFILLYAFHISIFGQNYLGLGAHFAPPVRIDNCCNETITANPLIVPAESYLFKKEWINKKDRRWYQEIGLTKQGIRINYTKYTNSLEFGSPWISFDMISIHAPAILYGIGRVLQINPKNSLSIGLESSFRISNIGQLETVDFQIKYRSDDVTFPLFLRPKIGYAYHFKLFNQIPAHVELYGKFSFQDIAAGPQYIRNSTSEPFDTTGQYRLNNSELGIHFFVDIGKEYYKINPKKKVKKEKVKKAKTPAKIRLSLTGQVFKPKATKYFIPRVDSFSIDGSNFDISHQIGIKAEFVHRKNENWSTVVGLHFGQITILTNFVATAPYIFDSPPIYRNQYGIIGHYIAPQFGLAYKHRLHKWWLQHTFSTTVTIPFIESESGFLIGTVLDRTAPINPPFKLVAESDFSNKEFNSPFLLGLEYQAEILFPLDSRVFLGFGLVANYSTGAIAEGTFYVDNGRTRYVGGVLQRFSKLGVSVRVGYQFFDPKL